jgi:uncharacterized protein (DUF1330 family)
MLRALSKDGRMSVWWKRAVAAGAGAVIGAVGVQMLHAQSTPRAYLIAEVQVTDPEAYKPYIPKAAQVVAQYGGQYLARGGKTESLEGAEPAGRVAVVQFPSMADLHKFWSSSEYREVAPIRHGASKSRFFVIEGVSP